jgi:hypothetical protein
MFGPNPAESHGEPPCRMTDEEPASLRPYWWECAWCKRRYVALDRREPAHVRGYGEYLFWTTHCLKGWQTERVPAQFHREAG